MAWVKKTAWVCLTSVISRAILKPVTGLESQTRPQTLKSVKINSYKNRQMTIHEPIEQCCEIFRMQNSQEFLELRPWASLGRAYSANSENCWIPAKLYSVENNVLRTEYDLIVPTKLNKLYSLSLSY